MHFSIVHTSKLLWKIMRQATVHFSWGYEGWSRKKTCKQSSFILFLLTREGAGNVLSRPVPKPVKSWSKSVVPKVYCIVKSPGFKRRKIPVCKLHPEEFYQNAVIGSKAPISILKRPPVYFSVCPVWESIWLNVSLETSTLDTTLLSHVSHQLENLKLLH